jgi:hypothetical protein
MKKKTDSAVWAICRGCRHHADISRSQNGRRKCSRCGSRDYTLTINDPSKPMRREQTDAGKMSATVVLPDDPPIEAEEHVRKGSYP